MDFPSFLELFYLLHIFSQNNYCFNCISIIIYYLAKKLKIICNEILYRKVILRRNRFLNYFPVLSFATFFQYGEREFSNLYIFLSNYLLTVFDIIGCIISRSIVLSNSNSNRVRLMFPRSILPSL